LNLFLQKEKAAPQVAPQERPSGTQGMNSQSGNLSLSGCNPKNATTQPQGTGQGKEKFFHFVVE
jgi:hypothetical protein